MPSILLGAISRTEYTRNRGYIADQSDLVLSLQRETVHC